MIQYNTPRNRLAFTYLTLIMVLSISFSFVFYNESTHAARSGFRRQVMQLRSNLYFAPPGSIDRMRDEGIHRFNNNLLARLLFLNFGMLIAGGYVSYYLAERSLQPLEEAMDAQVRFTSDAAHELRTPLTAMKSEIEVGLRSKKLSSTEARDLLSSNLEEIAKLETLTEALLRLAKNSNQPIGMHWKPVIVTDVIEDAVQRVKQFALKHGITFSVPARSDVTLRGDYDQLVELFVILFDNAIKYGLTNTVVTVTALHNSGSVVVAVSDKGIGIAGKDLAHIFDRFYRADQSRTKNKTSGYGLGLSLAEAIVKSHHGSIDVASTLNVGTTFTVTLPTG